MEDEKIIGLYWERNEDAITETSSKYGKLFFRIASNILLPFYEKCGFVRSYIVPNFFTDHYDHPIYECGVHLVDMVYLQRPL